MGQKLAAKRTSKIVIFKKELPFYVMLIPGVIFTLLFSYLPMFGLTMAFQNFTPLRNTHEPGMNDFIEQQCQNQRHQQPQNNLPQGDEQGIAYHIPERGQRHHIPEIF